MSEFRSTFTCPSPPNRIRYDHHLMWLGSCFSEHLGNHMDRLKFSSLTNPFGILYNPVSISRALARISAGYPYTAGDLILNQERWCSFDHHGRFALPDQTQSLEMINATLSAASAQLQQLDFLMLTLGTAFVFEEKQSGRVVANCHKFPASQFRRRRLRTDEVVKVLGNAIEQLRAVRPDIRIVLTVSPVRHLRDGVVENQRSKASLVLAVDDLCKNSPAVHYFPAYELLLDDLRDYRFYARDHIHPSEEAIDYIRKKFQQTFFDQQALELSARVEKLLQSLAHRPLFPQTEAHQQFQKKLVADFEALERQHPFLDFSKEKIV